MLTAQDNPDDAVLKAAIKGLYGRQRAPDDLRARMTQLLRSLDEPPEVPAAGALLGEARRTAQFGGSWGGAAMIAAVFAAGAMILRAGFVQPPRAALGPALLGALVETHDRCCCRHRHVSPGIPQTNLRLTGQAISRQLRQSVLAADLVKEQWIFRGAAICPVAGRNSAHLLFARGGQTLSVFSIADPLSPARQCILETQVAADHIVAGFVKRGRVYCMVGHCPDGQLSSAEVASLVERHRDELVDGVTTVAARMPDGGAADHLAWGTDSGPRR